MSEVNVVNDLRESLPEIKPVVENLVEQRVEITESEMCGAFAEYVFETAIAVSAAAEAAFARRNLTVSDVEEYIRWVLRKRIEQVARVKAGAEYKYVEYPVCLFPLLDTFGRLESYESGLVIQPEQLDAGPMPEKGESLMTVLKTHGIPVAKGLPVRVVSEDSLFYRLAIKDGTILASCDGSVIDPATVLTRVFYTMPIIELFGTPRYSLGLVNSQKSAFSLLARLGLKE